VGLHPIVMSILLLYNYKQLTECISEVERIEAKVEGLIQQQKEEEKKREWGFTQILSLVLSYLPV
jgi:hypothetical protein